MIRLSGPSRIQAASLSAAFPQDRSARSPFHPPLRQPRSEGLDCPWLRWLLPRSLPRTPKAPAPVDASPTRQSDEPIVRAHAGTFYRWETNSFYGYTHFIQVCTYQWNSDFDARAADAVAEWTELNGELNLSYAGWSDSTCITNWNNNARMLIFRAGGDLGDNTVARATPDLEIGGQGIKVHKCEIWIEQDGDLEDWGSYSWYAGTGSPGSTQVDVESALVHEIGHCLAHTGHSTESGYYIMNETMNPDGTEPMGIEKDEILYTHDQELYTDWYGNTH